MQHFAPEISADDVGAGVSDLDNVDNSYRSGHWRKTEITARPKGGQGAREGKTILVTLVYFGAVASPAGVRPPQA
jgi:hypothetical protein